MKLPIFAMLLFTASACMSTKQTQKASYNLNGVWIPTRQEMGGKEIPESVYKDSKLTLTDSVYTFGAAAIDKGVVSYNNGKIDIYGKDGPNKGKHYTAIYKLENDQLTICYNLAGDGYPVAFETASKPTYFLSVYKREGSK